MKAKRIDIIYGLHTVRHALERAPEHILEICIQKDRQASPEVEKILNLARSRNIAVQEFSRANLDKLTGQALHQGVVLKQRVQKADKQDSLEDILKTAAAPMLFLVLDGIQDPHNLGACLRTANAAGVDAVIIPKDRAASLNATVSKVASGAAENTTLLVVSNLARSLRTLQQAGVWVVGTAADGEHSLYDVDMSASTAIVMGGEGKGLRQNTREHCDYLVNLPMHGLVESLNVSAATAVCLYESLRQRRKPS